MSTPTKERGDLLVRISGNIKLIALWTCASRILGSSFTWRWKRRRNTTKLAWINAVILFLCGFMWWSAWKWSQSSTTNLAGRLAKKSGKSYSETETSNFMNSRMSIAIVQSKQHIHGTEDHAFPLWSEWANIPSGKMASASSYVVRHLYNNISQNWTKGFT